MTDKRLADNRHAEGGESRENRRTRYDPEPLALTPYLLPQALLFLSSPLEKLLLRSLFHSPLRYAFKSTASIPEPNVTKTKTVKRKKTGCDEL
ncbi:hypothetical protein AAC387_Pa02g4743 [Persea americana]